MSWHKYTEALDTITFAMNITQINKKLNNEEQEELGKAILTIRDLVDKEVPMKVDWRGVLADQTPYCPKCLWYCLSETYTNRYRCRNCNQKLDWSDD